MNVSHDPENLQFYLWLQDYKRRFYASSGREQALSPPWDEEALVQQYGMPMDSNFRQSERTLAKTMDYRINFDSRDIPLSPLSDKQSLMSGNSGGNTMNSIEYANAQTGLKWQACRCSSTIGYQSLTVAVTIQPFRSEVNRVIAQYLSPGAPRELNLSHKDRTACVGSSLTTTELFNQHLTSISSTPSNIPPILPHSPFPPLSSLVLFVTTPTRTSSAGLRLTETSPV